MEVNGAVVLITGASSGIGAATALAFDGAGARVALAARRRERLEELAATMNDALAVPTDLADAAQAEAMVEATVRHFGRLDVLVNNAATIVMARADTLDLGVLRRSLETNFVGAMIATNAAVRHMRRQGGGHVINIGSPGYMLGLPLFAPYTASKAAMSGWTRALQAEWAGTEIAVSEYLPGHIDSGAHPESELGDLGTDVFQDAEQSAVARNLVQLGRPEQVATDIVDLVRRPRAVRYSSPSVRLTVWLGLVARVRRSLGEAMARTVRRRLGIAVFSPLSHDGAAAAKKVAERPRKRKPKVAGDSSPARKVGPRRGTKKTSSLSAAAKAAASAHEAPAPRSRRARQKELRGARRPDGESSGSQPAGADPRAGGDDSGAPQS